MDRLWAPWRGKYINSLHKKQKGCVFCKIFRGKNNQRDYVFARTKHSFAVMNIYPYNNGHVLIVPNRHVNDLKKLTGEEKLDLLELFELAKDLLGQVLKPHGYNIGINIGRMAGAGFPGHVHVHIVPRWKGDVNFMPVTADTRVISQSIALLCEKLSHAYQKRNRRS